MLIRKSEADVETRTEMRGGTGEITITKHLPKEAMQGKCRLAATLTIPPGGSIGFHEHADEYEIFIIQQGTGTIDDNGTETPVEAGEAILTGGGEGHAITNTGETDLLVTAVILT